jgi:hypothetical protein
VPAIHLVIPPHQPPDLTGQNRQAWWLAVAAGHGPWIVASRPVATPSGWTGLPAYEAVVLKYIAKYVDRFSPGVLQEVESPHHMEAAVPDRIA